MLTGMSHLALTVKDMEKSMDFFCRVLRFKKAFELNEPQTGKPWIVYLHIGGRQFVELFYNGNKDNPWENGTRGFNHICFEVDDIHQFAKHVEAEGYTMDRPPVKGSDNNWQCWLTDPDGVRIEVMQISPDSPQGKIFATGL
jgi:catechol 2,3-dioxygenase-like lactoylglutathione lyase family enzyme